MKRLCAITTLLLWCLCAFGVQKSTTIVYINGAKYYVHTVQAGETLYALSKTYGVTTQSILQCNPSASEGLKINEPIKVPVIAEEPTSLSEKQIRKNFNVHTIVRGETLYAISRMFEIPIPTIVEDNPGMDPIRLRTGDKVLIRRKEVGDATESGSKEQWESYRQTLSSVAETGYAYHIVSAGETFYSLSHRFGLSEKQLSEINGGLKAYELKVGAMIQVPAPQTAQSQEIAQVTSIPNHESERAPSVEVDFRPLSKNQPLHVSLMLPLMTGEEATASANYLEFYQGFLLGLDSVRMQHGVSVKLTLYNTARDLERIQTLVEQDKTFNKSNLIIGPVYEEILHPVVRFAEQQAIPVVSPLASLSKINSDVLFQMAPAPGLKYKKATQLIEGKRITLIYSGSTDKEFEQEIKTMLGNVPYATHTYNYVHVSRVEAGDGSDLAPLLENSDDNLFVVLADSETDVDRILAALASADTNLTSRGRTAPRFTVLGNARWNRYTNIDRTIFFKDRVTFLTTYHAKRDSEVVAAFDGAYLRSFGAMPTLYSYRGYDAAMIFVPAMYNDIQYDMQSRTYRPLQTSYLFEQMTPGSNHINTEWPRVTYNTNFTITIE